MAFKQRHLKSIMMFERLHRAGFEVTSYITFINKIIDNERDVKLLHTQGIIQIAIRSNKAVAKEFNPLCKEVTLESHSSLEAMRKNVSKYCEQPSYIWRANLNRFRSPWSIFSLIGTIFFFALTIIQTICAVLSYV